jgi:hypothetical protein
MIDVSVSIPVEDLSSAAIILSIVFGLGYIVVKNYINQLKNKPIQYVRTRTR